MMRIVLATTARQKGGVWRHMTDVTAGLRARGHEVELDLVRTASLLREDAAARGFTVREASPRRAPDVWHLHLADTYCRDSLRSLVAARLSGAVVVVSEHLPRSDASDPSARSVGVRSRPGSWAAKTAFKRFEFSLSDRVIAASESSRRFLLTRYGVPPRKVVTIPYGVRPISVAPWSPQTPPRFVAVGSVITQKGFDLLIKAAALAEAPWSAEILGEGPHLTELQARRLASDGRSASSVGKRTSPAPSGRRRRWSYRLGGKRGPTWRWRRCNKALQWWPPGWTGCRRWSTMGKPASSSIRRLQGIWPARSTD